MTNFKFTIYNFKSIFNEQILKPALPAGGFKHFNFNSNLKLKIKNYYS